MINKIIKPIRVAAPVLNGNEKKYVNDCLDTSWISSNGKYIRLFENTFANFIGAKHAIAVSNGTVGLHLMLVALNVKAGDEVIMPTLSYIATANSAMYCGAKPVFIDSEKDTFNIDVKKIEEKITKKTKVLMPVHLYGHSVNMRPILDLAKKYNLYVVEDAAEALGCYYKGKHVGALGSCGVFSFFGNKNITTGEGGMVVTNDDELAAKMRLLKGQGMDPDKRYWHPIIGYNYRMTNIQAAIGLGQMEKIKFHLSRRQKIAGLYNKYLNSVKEYVDLPIVKPYSHHGYWMYTIMLKNNLKIPRDGFMRCLDEKGIETRPVFYPMHTMPPYNSGEMFPVAQDISSRGVNLPSHGLLTNDDIRYICNMIKGIVIK